MSQICFQFLVCHLRLTLGSCHFVLKASGNSNSTSFLSCFEGSLSSHNMIWKREDCKYRDGFNPLLRLNPLSPRDGQSLSWHPGATHEHVSPIPLGTSWKPVPVSSMRGCCGPSLSCSPSNSTHTHQETQTSFPLFIDPGVSSRWQQEENRLLCVHVCRYQRDGENIWPLVCTDSGLVCNRAGAGGKLDANAE